MPLEVPGTLDGGEPVVLVVQAEGFDGQAYGVVTVGGLRVELDEAGLRRHAAHLLVVADQLGGDGRWHPSWCRRGHTIHQAHESVPIVLPGAAMVETLPGEVRPLQVFLSQGGDRAVTLVTVEAYDAAVVETEPAEVLIMPLDLASVLAGTVLRLVDDAARDLA
ncbi:hypothetical protein ACFQ1L_11800 [Phytohabitans flavus]|uniref:hypothetical protein n=1 Tax=Phytohabitans flavus TaxID=1076124 RepID=UPI0036372811